MLCLPAWGVWGCVAALALASPPASQAAPAYGRPVRRSCCVVRAATRLARPKRSRLARVAPIHRAPRAPSARSVRTGPVYIRNMRACATRSRLLCCLACTRAPVPPGRRHARPISQFSPLDDTVLQRLVSAFPTSPVAVLTLSAYQPHFWRPPVIEPPGQARAGCTTTCAFDLFFGLIWFLPRGPRGRGHPRYDAVWHRGPALHSRREGANPERVPLALVRPCCTAMAT